MFGGYGGTFVIADASYAEIARVRAGNGYKADLHEILITSRNTALITIYNEIRADLTPVGGAVDARLVEGIIQEIDIPSGRVLFEWHSLDHIALEESSELAVTRDGNVDYFHLNSIGVDSDGHLLVSARHTSAVYKLHRRTGQVIWRLGGTRSDFALGPGVSFGYQHDARRHSDGTLTIFDNAASLPTQRGLRRGRSVSGSTHPRRRPCSRATTRRRTCARPGQWATRSRSPMAASSSAGEPSRASARSGRTASFASTRASSEPR